MPPKAHHRAIIIASFQGEIQFAEREAICWLRLFFGRPTRARLLPKRICRWLELDSGTRAAKLLIARHGDAQLFVSRQQPHATHCFLLLLEMVKERSADFARTHGALTARENEVLHWLKQGKSNWEIAQILDLMPSTVGKHLERIYPKLGVENRTAAVQFAM